MHKTRYPFIVAPTLASVAARRSSSYDVNYLLSYARSYSPIQDKDIFDCSFVSSVSTPRQLYVGSSPAQSPSALHLMRRNLQYLPPGPPAAGRPEDSAALQWAPSGRGAARAEDASGLLALPGLEGDKPPSGHARTVDGAPPDVASAHGSSLAVSSSARALPATAGCGGSTQAGLQGRKGPLPRSNTGNSSPLSCSASPRDGIPHEESESDLLPFALDVEGLSLLLPSSARAPQSRSDSQGGASTATIMAAASSSLYHAPSAPAISDMHSSNPSSSLSPLLMSAAASDPDGASGSDRPYGDSAAVNRDAQQPLQLADAPPQPLAVSSQPCYGGDKDAALGAFVALLQELPEVDFSAGRPSVTVQQALTEAQDLAQEVQALLASQGMAP